MDTKRLILFIVFSFSLLMLWEGWQGSHLPPAAPPVANNAASTQQTGVPTPSPVVRPSAVPGAVPGTVPGAAEGAAEPQIKRQPIEVQTDMVRAQIDPVGGNVIRLALLRHKDSVNNGEDFALLGPQHRYAAQSGLIRDQLPGQNKPALPNHKTLFSADAQSYVLRDGQDVLEVRLHASSADGIKVTKILRFHRGSYLIDVTQQITNDSDQPLAAHAYYQFTRDSEAAANETFMAHTFTGPGVYTEEEHYKKISFSDIDKGKASYPKHAEDGWIAMVQHYFVSAWAPSGSLPREFYVKKLGQDFYSAGLIVPVAATAPGQSTSLTMPLYSGPQEQQNLQAIAPGLEHVVDYGYLTIIAVPLFKILKFLHGWLGNWGLAIIGLSVLIKLVFFPLSAASYKSMAKMRLVAPRLQKLKEQYGNDRARMNQAMMELYKTEKINPLGGCLPIVVQIPVFIALYWALLGSVELRHAPFYGWIHDLSAQDPFFILPALMMVSMFIQTRLSPTSPDPVQAKIMTIMPLVFGIMFFFFPAGLVLYWLVNNILSIAQQWQITRVIEGGKTKKPAAASAKH
jgi:YidC/Oxa1 family membrane protein insertase